MTRLSCEKIDLGIGNVTVTEDLDIEFKPGTFWGLLGSNGVGKTTLLKCLAGLHPAQSGRVLLESSDISALPRKTLARHLGMLQQHTAYVFDSSVLQTALTGRHPHLTYWQREGPEDIDKANSALAAVDLADLGDRSVTGLSGGEARRLAFAALLVQEPDIMLLDEPSNHLDLKHQVQIMGMIRDHVKNETGTAIAALHDVNLAARYCSHVLMLFGNGKWCAGTCEEMLSESSLERLYGCPVEKLQARQGARFYPLGSSG